MSGHPKTHAVLLKFINLPIYLGERIYWGVKTETTIIMDYCDEDKRILLLLKFFQVVKFVQVHILFQAAPEVKIWRCYIGEGNGHKFFEITWSSKKSASTAIVKFTVCAVAPCCCDHHYHSVSFSSYSFSEGKRTSNLDTWNCTAHAFSATVQWHIM